MRTITRILMLAKTGHEGASLCAQRMTQWLSDRGVECHLACSGEECGWYGYVAKKGTESCAVIVLGGDGTLVGVLRRMVDAEVYMPVMGVNFGKVGFLAEIAAADWEPVLTDLLEGRAERASRMALHWRVLRPETNGTGNTVIQAQGHAVNDIVVGRGALARVLQLGMSVNGREICRLRADGMLVSTPAGTTGYAGSAGGSLVHPDVPAIMVTPIAPFLNRMHPMVLPVDSEICLTHISGSEAYLTVDGQDGVDLTPGDTVCVRAVPKAFELVLDSRFAYYERLARCGFVATAEQGTAESTPAEASHA